MKRIIFLILMIMILIVAGCASEKVETTTTTVQQNMGDNTVDNTHAEMQMDGYAISEVAKHSTEASCWIVIDGKVYDVTEFIGQHPGGQAILEGCGRDATELYNTRPMGSGTPHSGRARGILDDYEIGILA